MLVFFAILTANSVTAEPARRPWASVTKAPSNTHEVITLDFGTLGRARSGARIDALVYYAKRIDKPLRGAPNVRWTDSVSRPALEAALVRLRTVPAPKIDLPGYPPQEGGFWEKIILDGTVYSLDMAPYLTFSTNDENAPLSRWTEKALRELEPCWNDKAPADT
jgi:hypothetical protein